MPDVTVPIRLHYEGIKAKNSGRPRTRPLEVLVDAVYDEDIRKYYKVQRDQKQYSCQFRSIYARSLRKVIFKVDKFKNSRSPAELNKYIQTASLRKRELKLLGFCSFIKGTL